MTTRRRRIVALVDDLMVRSRIEAATPADTEVTFPTDSSTFAATLEPPPDLIVVGMAATRRPWPELLRTARDHPASCGVPVVAFGPHKDLELRRQALEAGADRVLANSAFLLALPRLLRGELPPDGTTQGQQDIDATR
jgi:DNA-binding NarL/FixJ family response regulator